LQTIVGGLPSSASYSFDSTIKIEGTVVTATVGPLSFSATISSADVTAMSLGTLSGFSSSGACVFDAFFVNQVVPQVVTASSITTTWTVASQAAFRVKLYEAAGPVLVHDSGWVSTTNTSYTIPFVLVDNTTYRIDVQTQNSEGLASNIATITFSVDFVEPPTPTLVAAAHHALGVIQVRITNPAPGGGQPLLAGNDLYRRMVGATGLGTKIYADQIDSATINDFTAASGIDYEYRALAKGVNGTSQYSTWSA
jgi:hypothetical protein